MTSGSLCGFWRRPGLHAGVRRRDLEYPQGERHGPAAEYSFTDSRIVRSERALGGLDLGKGKPAHIFAQTGRLPTFAGGNADVDIEMLSAATSGLLVNHDDEDREFVYTNRAEKSLAKAQELGWTVGSMKRD